MKIGKSTLSTDLSLNVVCHHLEYEKLELSHQQISCDERYTSSYLDRHHTAGWLSIMENHGESDDLITALWLLLTLEMVY